jgi:hypothetical protein
LPWVSRAHHEEVIAAWRAAVEETRTPIRETFARFDALLEKYHALRLQGAEAPPPLPKISELPPRTVVDPDAELKGLIAEQAGPDLRKRAIMLRQLKRDRLDGVSVEEIRKQIEQGVQSDGVMA